MRRTLGSVRLSRAACMAENCIETYVCFGCCRGGTSTWSNICRRSGLGLGLGDGKNSGSDVFFC
jgi:hypothetical protein